MSGQRHFLGTLTGTVYSPDHPERFTGPGYVEVQVAPIDAIVIDRSELPEIETETAHSGPGVFANNVGWSETWLTKPHHDGRSRAQYARDMGLAYLAVAEYLRANPPVDEAQVHAVADRLHSDTPIDATDRAELESIARRLVQNGVRVEVTP